MKILLDTLNAPLIRSVGWALLHSIWQGALIGGFFELARWGLRRGSAQARYLAGCAALTILLAAPIATLYIETAPAGEGIARTGAGDKPAGAVAARMDSPRLDVSRLAAGQPLFTGTGADVFRQIVPWLTLCWALGVGVFSIKLAGGWRWEQAIRTANHLPAEAQWREKLDELRRRMRISRSVGLLKSALVEVPTVIGWLRPIILLPAASLTGLAPDQWEAIIVHELAHIRRHDYLVNAFQCAVETLLFYHPVAWWISRCVREERENCCDDVVIEVCGDRVGYARALTALEEFRAGLPALALGAGGGSLLKRIRRMLGLSCEAPASLTRRLGGRALLGLGVVIVLFGAWLYSRPTTYESTARIRLARDATDIRNTAQRQFPSDYDPYFIQSEFELIQSQVILGEVIDLLDLNTKWGEKYRNGEKLQTQETMQLLKGHIAFSAVPNTTMIDIRVISKDKDEAALIANTIAKVYRNHRLGQQDDLRMMGIAALRQRFKDKDQEIQSAQGKLNSLRAELGISELEANDTAPTPTLGAATFQRQQAEINTYEMELTRERTQVGKLAALDPDHRRDAIQTALGQQDPELNALLGEIDAAENKLVSLKNNFATDHPTYQTALQVRDNYVSLANRRVEGMMLGLSNRLGVTEATIKSLSDRLLYARDIDINKASRNAPYYEARKNLENLLNFRKVLDMKIASEQIDLDLPKTAVVEIVNNAEPGLRPVAPNRELAAALIAIGALLVAAGLITLQGGSSPDISRLNAAPAQP